MSEGRATGGQWLNVEDAAAQLGISRNALRQRLRRGSLEGQKQAGKWRVWIPGDAPSAQVVSPERDGLQGVHADTAELVQSLQDQIASLRVELEARRKYEQELWILVSQQSERLSELTSQVRAVTAPPESRESPANVAESRCGVSSRHRSSVMQGQDAKPKQRRSLKGRLRGFRQHRDAVIWVATILVITLVGYGVHKGF